MLIAYTLNKNLKYLKQNLKKLEKDIYKSKVIIGDFRIPPPEITRISIHKINKELGLRLR
jgi:hypothetical protein